MNGSGSWISLLTEGSARKALANATGEAVGAYPTGQAAPPSPASSANTLRIAGAS